MLLLHAHVNFTFNWSRWMRPVVRFENPPTASIPLPPPPPTHRRSHGAMKRAHSSPLFYEYIMRCALSAIAALVVDLHVNLLECNRNIPGTITFFSLSPVRLLGGFGHLLNYCCLCVSFDCFFWIGFQCVTLLLVHFRKDVQS